MWLALKRAGCWVVVFGGYVNCAFVPQLFQQLINTMFCPAFFQEIRLSTSLLCTSLNTNFLSKSCFCRWIPCCLLTNNAITSAVTNFWCHKMITIVNKKKNNDMENFICNRYGERLHILNREKFSAFMESFLTKSDPPPLAKRWLRPIFVVFVNKININLCVRANSG